MKKLMAIILSMLMLTTTIPVGALTLDDPEISAETKTAEQTALLSESIHETADTVAKTGTLGELIWFEGFEHIALDTNAPRETPEYSSSTYSSPYALSGSSLSDLKPSYSGINQASVMTDPDDPANKVLRLQKGSQYGGLDLVVGKQTLSKPGIYTTELDIYPINSGYTEYNITYYINGYGGHSAQGFSITPGKWNHLTKTSNSMRVYTKEEAAYYGDFEWSENADTGAYTAPSHVKDYPAYIHDIFTFNGQGGTATSYWYYLDNIKIWYQEYADVTFDVSGDASAELTEAMDGLLHRSYVPGEDLIVPDLSGTDYTFNGWKDADGNTVTKASAGTVTLYADVSAASTGIRETVDTVAKKSDLGELIWFEDFERIDVNTNAPRVAPAYSSSTFVSPYRLTDGSLDAITLSYSGVSQANVQLDPEDANNHVLRFQKGSQYAGIELKDNNQVFSKPGVYTTEMDIYPIYWGLSEFNITYYVNGYNGHSAQGFSLTSDKWNHLSKTKNSMRVYTKEEAAYYGEFEWTENESTGAYTAPANKLDYPAYIHDIYAFNGQGGTQSNFWGSVDNIKVWYLEYADVTFDVSGDASAALTEAMDGLLHRSYVPGEDLIVPDLSGTDYTFNGWKDADGNTVTKASAGTVTLYADVSAASTGIRETVDTVAKKGDLGELIWFEDFERIDVNTNAPRVAPAYSSSTFDSPYRLTDGSLDAITLSYSGVSQANVQPDPEDANNHVLRFQKGSQYAGIELKDNNQVFSKPGVYTTEMDIYPIYWGLSEFNITYYVNGYNGHSALGFSLTSDKWNHLSKTKNSMRVYTKEEAAYYGEFEWTENESTGAYTAPANKLDYPAYIHDIYAFNGQGGTQSNFWGSVDNIKVWYLEYADVTFDVSGDASAELTEAMDGLLHRSYVPGEDLVVPSLAGKGYVFNGWKDKDGNTVTKATAGAMTLYPDVTEHDDTVVYFFDTDGADALMSMFMEYPMPSLLGFEDENFVGWLGEDGKVYKPSANDDFNRFVGKTFRAVRQDASAPAMGIAYEMNDNKDSANPSTNGLSFGKLSVEYVDGIAIAKNTKSSGSDPRINADTYGIPNPGEYYIFQAREKPVASVKPTARLYFYVNGEAPGYSCTSDGTHQFDDVTMETGKWNLIELNLETVKNWSKHNWGKKMTSPWSLGSLWFDVAKDDLSAEAGTYEYQIDYIRLYRGGYNTVNYYDGDTLLFADENRGLGVGYLLNGTIPVKDGYVFAGWEDEYGDLIENNTIDLVGDTNVYAAWIKAEAPTTYTDFVQIRPASAASNNQDALRFMASVTGDQHDYASEYGFLVTRKSLTPDTDDVTFDSKITCLKAVAYNAESGTDIVFNIDDDGTVYYTVACYNIPEDKHDDKLLVRSYLKLDVSGRDVTLYGLSAVKCLNDALAD